MTHGARSPLVLLSLLLLTGCAAQAPPAASVEYTVRPIALPAAPPEGVGMDYLAYDRAQHRVWVPAGNTASVDVIDTGDGHVTRVAGFATATREWHGKTRTVGPSSATVGDGVVYVGNRGDSSVCAIDARSLRVGACLTVESSPDGLAYVAASREVWVTTPRDHSIVILAASPSGALTWKAKLPLDGQPEGFAVDDRRGVFYTNFEDQDRTLAIDVSTRRVTHTWLPGCGAAGPRGLALDPQLNVLFVACTDHVATLDAAHDGRRLATLSTGEGVDNIDYVEPRHELYAAAGRAATLTVAHVDPAGGLTRLATVATRPGARNAVVTDDGVAYVANAAGGQILVVAPVTATK